MRRIIIAFVIFVVVVVGVALTVVWDARRTQPPVPNIVVPHYAEPEDNWFGALAEAAARLDADTDALKAAFEMPWDEDNPVTGGLLERHATTLEAAGEALKKQCLHPRPQSADELWPWLMHLRGLTRLLILEGRHHERQAQPGRAVRSYLDALSLGPIVARNGVTVHAVVGFSITRLTAPELARCIGSGGLSGGELERLQQRLGELVAERVPWHETLAVEWAFEDKILTEMETGKLDPNAVVQLLHPTAMRMPPGQFHFDAARREITEILAKAIEDAKKPYWQRSYQIPTPKTLLAETLMPVFARAHRKSAERDTVLAGLGVQAAVELFRARQGRLPSSLAQLTPDCLDQVPLDPFDGKPLRYQQTEGGYVLYSVGPDGSDGGGQERLDRETYAGDMIIWPWGPVMKPRTDYSSSSQN